MKGYICALLWIAILPVSVFAAEAAPCGACHADVAKGFENEVHGRAFAQVADASCTSCHGPADAHLRGPSTPGSIQSFSDDVPAEERSAACTGCHTDVHEPGIDAHRQAGLACNDCHQAHGASEASESAVLHGFSEGSSSACGSCHEDTFAQFAFNESHRLADGSVSCTSCHDPHSVSLDVGLASFAGGPCSQCHADKEGPFVFEHGASRVEGCTACHDPHGSANRHLLTHQATGDLCYSCHAAVPQFHLGFSPVAPIRFGGATVCTNCHVTIHGSNLDRVFLR